MGTEGVAAAGAPGGMAAAAATGPGTGTPGLLALLLGNATNGKLLAEAVFADAVVV